MNRRFVMWLLALAATASTALAQGVLPELECVRLTREARIAESGGDVDRALALLTEAVERFPNEVTTLQELLRIHLTRELPEEHTEDLRARLRDRIADPELPLSAGSITFLVRHAGDDQEMLAALLGSVERRLERTPGDLELLKARASVQGRLGMSREARATLATLLELEPSFNHVSRAVWLDLDLERWESALELVEPWVEDPEFGAALHNVYLELLAKAGDTERLIAGLAKLRESRSEDILSDSGYLTLQKRIAWSLLDSGEAELAERLWREVLAESPGDLEASRVVANLFGTEQERRRLSAEVDDRIESLENPVLLLDQGIQYLATGDHRRAYDIFSRLTEVYSSKEEFWFNYGVAAIALEEWETAAHAFGSARLQNGERAATHFQLAKALRELGRCGEAIVAMKAGLALEPDRSNTYYFLAQCYDQVGKPGEAALAMEEYRKRRSQ